MTQLDMKNEVLDRESQFSKAFKEIITTLPGAIAFYTCLLNFESKNFQVHTNMKMQCKI